MKLLQELIDLHEGNPNGIFSRIDGNAARKAPEKMPVDNSDPGISTLTARIKTADVDSARYSAFIAAAKSRKIHLAASTPDNDNTLLTFNGSELKKFFGKYGFYEKEGIWELKSR